jgi:hypothetical protein
MHEPVDSCLARNLRHSLGGPHMDGLKCILPALDKEAYGVNDSPGTADSTGDRAIVVYVCVERHDVGAVAGSRQTRAIGVPRRDPNGKTASMQMANDGAAEKPGSAKYRDNLPSHGNNIRCCWARRASHFSRLTRFAMCFSPTAMGPGYRSSVRRPRHGNASQGDNPGSDSANRPSPGGISMALGTIVLMT